MAQPRDRGEADAALSRRVALIVPYRDENAGIDRAAHLRQFVPYMQGYLARHGIACDIYVVEQLPRDGNKFNRGYLLNAGYTIAKRSATYHRVIFHDVDLLPSEALAPSYMPEDERAAVHIAACWRRYPAEAYLGGAVSMLPGDFERINGFPNLYWGWGGEDDELRRRLRHAGIAVRKVRSGTMQDLEGMGLKQKLQFLRDTGLKCGNKWELSERAPDAWERDGLSSMQFHIVRHAPLPGSTADASATFVTVRLEKPGTQE